MKYLFLLMCILFLTNITNAQNVSVGFDYSGQITSNNYESVSIYTIGGDFEFEESNLSVGVDFSAFIGEINFKTLAHPSSSLKTFTESVPLIRINVKYYPSLFEDYLNEDIKPYFVVAVGKALIAKSFTTNNNHTFYCGDHYSFSNKQYYYTNIGLGSIFAPTQLVSFLFELQYQFNKPTITYEKPNCSGNFIPDSYSNFTEKVNLNMLFWTFGFRINL